MSRPPDLAPLQRPVVIAAFEGWNDAASDAVDHLSLAWGAQEFAALDPDDYDFQVNRPFVRLVDDGAREISWPTCRFSVCRPPGGERDAVLVRGHEHNMRWRSSCEEVLAVATEVGAEMLVTLGALLADSPQTRPVPVGGTASDPATTEAFGLKRSRYEGPTGIVGVLQDRCARAGLPAVSFWAAVPHYVSSPPVPKAVLSLLRRVEDLLDLPVPLGELPEQARTWERSVDEVAADDAGCGSASPRLRNASPRSTCPRRRARPSRRCSSATCGGVGTTSVADAPSMRPVRHVILFRLYPDANPDEVLRRLRSLGNQPGVLEWRIERSLDERKGVVVMQNSLFASTAALQAFRVNPVHAQVAAFLSSNADWLVADHLE